MKVVVTDATGCFNSALSIKLLERADEIVGIDNHNDCFDTILKDAWQARHEDHHKLSTLKYFNLLNYL